MVPHGGGALESQLLPLLPQLCELPSTTPLMCSCTAAEWPSWSNVCSLRLLPAPVPAIGHVQFRNAFQDGDVTKPALPHAVFRRRCSVCGRTAKAVHEHLQASSGRQVRRVKELKQYPSFCMYMRAGQCATCKIPLCPGNALAFISTSREAVRRVHPWCSPQAKEARALRAILYQTEPVAGTCAWASAWGRPTPQLPHGFTRQAQGSQLTLEGQGQAIASACGGAGARFTVFGNVSAPAGKAPQGLFGGAEPCGHMHARSSACALLLSWFSVACFLPHHITPSGIGLLHAHTAIRASNKC